MRTPKIHRWAFGSAIPGVHTRRNWSARQVDNAAAPTASVRRASRSCSASASSGTQAEQQVGRAFRGGATPGFPARGFADDPALDKWACTQQQTYRYATELERVHVARYHGARDEAAAHRVRVEVAVSKRWWVAPTSSPFASSRQHCTAAAEMMTDGALFIFFLLLHAHGLAASAS
jgi:hypothetical protein